MSLRIPSFPVKMSGWDGSSPANRNSLEKGGGGPHDPLMEARVAVLEEIAKTTKDALAALRADASAARDRADRDFRLLFGALIVVALGLAGLLAKGFHWV